MGDTNKSNQCKDPMIKKEVSEDVNSSWGVLEQKVNEDVNNSWGVLEQKVNENVNNSWGVLEQKVNENVNSSWGVLEQKVNEIAGHQSELIRLCLYIPREALKAMWIYLI